MDYKAIVEKLEQGVKDVWQSDSFRSYLNTMSKFHDYSYNNVLLIMAQKPNASLVAGFKKWKGMNRNVKKGEKAIYILAPSMKKMTVEDKETGIRHEKNCIVWFRPVTVFDISQTEGEDLPSIQVNELHGDVNEYETIMEQLKSMATVPVEYEDIKGAKGYCSAEKIALNKGMSELQTVKTMIHELAHNLLGHIESHATRDEKEVQAEGTAYVVAQAIGLDTSEYSFGYVAGWASEQDENVLKSTLQSIQKTAQKIIKGLTA